MDSLYVWGFWDLVAPYCFTVLPSCESCWSGGCLNLVACPFAISLVINSSFVVHA